MIFDLINKGNKEILVNELEKFHDLVLLDGVCLNRLRGFEQYIKSLRIAAEFSVKKRSKSMDQHLGSKLNLSNT